MFIKKHLTTFLIVANLFYFSYHLVTGKHGLLSWSYLKKRIEKKEILLKNLETQEKDYRKIVDLLRSNHVDKDLLEERARILLNFMYPDDLVIYDEKS